MNVTKIQERLNELGFGPLMEDGIFGTKTKNAISHFQMKHSLQVDGIPGAKTLAILMPDSKPYSPSWALKPIKAHSLTLRHRALEIAISQDGVREMTGKNDGAAVETFLSSVGLPKGYAWCMAFVYWCYQQAAIQLGVANPLVRTAGCIKQWNSIDPVFRCKKPLPGDIFIMDLGKGSGHTGIVREVMPDGTLITIEGNTNDKGSPDGDGVYTRSRLLGGKIIGYIRPI